MTANPLLTDWTTPFELPPFSNIEPSHFEEAFEVSMAEARAEIDAIADQAAPATFENTVVALETSGKALSKVARTFFNLSGAHTSEALQKIERDHRAESLPNTVPTCC